MTDPRSGQMIALLDGVTSAPTTSSVWRPAGLWKSFIVSDMPGGSSCTVQVCNDPRAEDPNTVEDADWETYQIVTQNGPYDVASSAVYWRVKLTVLPSGSCTVRAAQSRENG